jgi:hypothetical protein
MAVSAETQAILDELKNQGELTRSKDRNFSMKSSQQSFEKFGEAFETIGQTMQEQTNILKQTLGISMETQRAQEKAAKIAAIQQENKQEATTQAAPREVAKQSDSLLGLIGKSLGGLGSVFKTLLIGGGLGYVAFNFVKGFVDRTFGEGTVDGFVENVKTFMIETSESLKENVLAIPGFFIEFNGLKDKMKMINGVFDIVDWEGVVKPKIEAFQEALSSIDFEGIDWQNSVKPKLLEFQESLSSIDLLGFTSAFNGLSLNLDNINGVFSGITNWEELKLSMTNLADKLPPAVETFTDFLSNPMTYILPALTGAVATRAAIQGVANAALPGSAGGQSPVRNLKNGIIGSFALGMTIYGNRLKEWVNNESGLADVDIGGQDAASLASMGIDIGTGALQGASIGMFFGPTGALVGAILGGTVTLGMKLFDWWQGKAKENEAETQREMDAADRKIRQRRRQRRQELESDLDDGPAPLGPVSPRPSNSRRASRWDNKYGDTHNPDGSVKILPGPTSQRNTNLNDTVSEAGAGGGSNTTVVVNSPTTIAPNVTSVAGDNTASSANVVVAGGGNGNSNLPNAANE